MKKITEFLKNNWINLLIGTIIIGLAIYLGILCVHMTSEEPTVTDTQEEPTITYTQEELDLELIDIDIQAQYDPDFKTLIEYRFIHKKDDYNVYLVTYLMCIDGENKILNFAAGVKCVNGEWDVDTEPVIYE